MIKVRTPDINKVKIVCLFFILFFPFLRVSSQGLYVRGCVTETNGDALPGVNILIQGTSMGTITDLDGNYSCYVPGPKATLVYSFVGFKTQTIQINNQEMLNVIMMVDVKALEEIVVTGYTTEELRKITSSITKIDPREIQTIPVSNVAEQLTGRAPGVFVINSGIPGGSVKVRIRGFSTINDNNPLYIVDGIPVEYNWIKFLNTFDIESIQVLKDAASASIYGARASNGVIVITTRNGKPTGESHFTFDGFTGVQVVPRNAFPKMLNPRQHAMVKKISDENCGNAPYHPQYTLSDGSWGLPDYLYPAAYSESLDGKMNESTYDRIMNPITKANKEGTNWVEEISKPALIHNYNIAATGGSHLAQYAFSLGYFNQDGIVIHTGYQKYSSRINSVVHIRDRLHIGENIGITYEKSKNTSFTDGYGWSYLSHTFWIPQIIPVYDIAGNYTGSRIDGFMEEITNPVASLTRNKDNNKQMINLLGSLFIEYDITDDLHFKTSFSPNFYLTLEDKSFTPIAYENHGGGTNRLNQRNINMYNWTWYNTIIYNKEFKYGHNLKVLAGTEAIDSKTNYIAAGRSNYAYEDLNYRQLNTGEREISNGGSNTEWSLFSAFGKLDYDFLDKYLVSGTFRYDGSSKFGQNNRFAFFPAFSAGWRLTGESFMSNFPFFDNILLRASWGETGNQNIGDYRIYNSYTINPMWTSYPLKGLINESDIGLVNNVLGNPNVKWESTTTLDAGFDMTLFNNSVDLKFDWYRRETTGMLMELTEPAIFGIVIPPYGNIGNMLNTGFEFSLVYYSPVERDFSWSAGLNFSHYKNTVLKLNSPDQEFYSNFAANITKEGYPISSIFGLQQIGLFQSVEEAEKSPYQETSSHIKFYNEIRGDSMEIIQLAPGRMKFQDINGDDTIRWEDDQTFLGSPHPDFYFGIPLNLKFKKWNLNIFCYGSFGNEIYNQNRFFTDLFWAETGSTKLLEAWGMPGADNTKAAIPKVGNISAPEEVWYNNSYLVEDASFLRIQQVNLSYTFEPKSWKNTGNFRIFFQANNILTLTKYTGFDPNFGNETNNDMNMGWEQGQYPSATSYMVGANINF